MSEQPKILLSGVKPTGRPHIGNYFGAMRQFVDLQHEYDNFIMIADYHALINIQNAKELAELTLDVAIDYLAIGLTPEKVTIFKQSDITEHTELTWIFNCITTMPYLMRAHAYKDAQQKNKEVSVGLFDYPLLMASDILLYNPDVVPVGQDQKQHLEIARDTAEKFNQIFGETFRLPEPLIIEDVGTIQGIDGRKMSKSYNNTIPLFSEDEEIEKLTMSIITDSRGTDEPKDPDSCNVFALHRLFSKEMLANLDRRYRESKIGYKESKEILAENIKNFVRPLREKRKEIADDKVNVLNILKMGNDRAREKAELKMREVRDRIGVNLK